VLPALTADTALHISGIGAVLEGLLAGCRQCGLELLGPLLVGFGESPHLVGGQAKVAEHRAERLTCVDDRWVRGSTI
jgi:hypothetical protein